MNDDSVFDPLETELRRRFDNLATGHDDPDAVLDNMRPRLHRARRTHRLVNASAAALLAVGIVAVGLSAYAGSHTGTVQVPPAGHSTNVTGVTTPDAGDSRTGATTPDGSGNTHGRVDDTGVGGTPASSLPGTHSSPTTTVKAPTTVSSTPTSSTTPTTIPIVSDTPYSSPGGSIVVHNSGSAISLVSSIAVAGYATEIHDNGPTRVEVRFNNGLIEWRIQIDLVNGILQVQITQH
jgi:hypothetical protein